MERRSRDIILEEYRKHLLRETQEWMAQYEIPSQGESITITLRIQHGNDPIVQATAKRQEQPRLLTEEEWSQALLVVEAPKQKALLEFLHDSPGKQRSSRELNQAGFSYHYLRSPTNRTLKSATLPFALMKLRGQRGKRGGSWDRPISLVVLLKN